MKWVRFGALATFAAPCVGVRGDRAIVVVSGRPHHCDRHHSLVKLFHQFFRGVIAVLILQEPPRPLALCFHDLNFFGGGFFSEEMHVLDRISRSFCTCGPTDRLVRAFPFKLIGGRGTRAPPPLGFNILFLNQSLPWRALRPTFRILSMTRKCSFNLEFCWASKSIAHLIFTIQN
jgi:hypothetical protein